MIHDTRWLAPVLRLAKDGRIDIENLYETNLKGVFAGGDCIRNHPASMRISQLDGAAMAERARYYVEVWHKRKGIQHSNP
jgi:alkyl hydroperoxide reductase subunit AhpF